MRWWPRLSQVGAALSVTAALLLLPGTSPLPDAAPLRSAVDRVPLEAVRPPARLVTAPALVARHVVALGDSVPEGAACGCTPYPALYAAQLSRREHVPVRVEDLAQGGQETSGLIDQLGQPATSAAVRAADVVLVTIGANDFEDREQAVVGGGCAGTCVTDELWTLRRRLDLVLARIRGLRAGAPTSVLVTGYWNVFRDGPVARTTYGAGGVRTAVAVTRSVNAAIAAATAAAGGHYVDLFTPFQARGAAIGSLLAPDGDHPDAAGHALIAQALVAAGLPLLR